MSSKMQYYGGSKLLLFDIGNTRTKVRVITNSSKKDYSFPTCEIENQIKEFNPQSLALVASVVEEANKIIKNYFSKTKFVNCNLNLPIKINYSSPEKLGPDRIALACGGLSYENSFIVISAGTTTVIDIVKEKTFLGGWILPGIQLSSQCLNKFTSKLPLITSFQPLNIYAPGTSTNECIQKGILLFTISTIKEIQKKYNLPTLLTGGNGKLLTNYIKAKFIENLTLIGLETIANFSSLP